MLAFAIEYAERGYPVVAGITMTIERSEPLLREWPASAELYLPAPQPGTTFRNPQLAATWTRLLDEARGGSREEEIERARRVFYEGFVAEEIDAFSRDNGGLLTGDDMREWHATIEPPVTFDYRGLTVCKTGPWGQGPGWTAAARAALGIRRRRPERGAVRPRRHRVREARVRRPRRRLRRRAAVPIETLLSAEYNDQRRKLVTDEASDELRPGLGRLPAAPHAK